MSIWYVRTNIRLVLRHHDLFLGAGPLYSRETASRNFRGFYPLFSVYANEFGYVCDDRYEIGGTFVEGTLK